MQIIKNRLGLESVKELIAKKEQEALQTAENAKKVQGKETVNNTIPPKDALPSYAKSLDQIIKMEKIAEESSESISLIWNKYHASQDCLSSSIPSDSYTKLFQRGKQFPMVITNFIILVCTATCP